MARLDLKHDRYQGKDKIAYVTVGSIIAAMAKTAREGNELQAVEQHTKEFKALFDNKFHCVELAPPPDVPADFEDGSVILRFHFDRSFQTGGKKLRVVNVVVPDAEDKLDQLLEPGVLPDEMRAEFERSVFDLRQIAREALGFIVICGCAN